MTVVRTDRPFFSVVIPTRNRIHLLGDAVRSVLAQTWQNYELVVSDNASSGDIPALLAGFGDARIRYVRTPELLAMPDSWEFALSHARGEYVTYLSDDDALLRSALERIAGIISTHKAEVVTWAIAHYNYPDWYDPAYRNVVQVRPFSQRVTRLNSAQYLLRFLDELRVDGIIPTMSQTACYRGILADIRSRTGRVFMHPAPDITFSVALMTIIDSFVHIDTPLAVYGNTAASTRINSLFDGGDSYQSFLREFRDQHIFKHMPLSAPLTVNIIAESALATRSLLGVSPPDLSFNWATYYQTYASELRFLTDHDLDVSHYETEFSRVAPYGPASATPTPNEASSIAKTIRRGRAEARAAVDSTVLKRLEYLVRPTRLGLASASIWGDRAKFRGIRECAAFLDRELPRGYRRLAARWHSTGHVAARTRSSDLGTPTTHPS